jgi:hypothetical protein
MLRLLPLCGERYRDGSTGAAARCVAVSCFILVFVVEFCVTNAAHAETDLLVEQKIQEKM